MREQDALYGGEMSAHHYFRNFYYCDSGMIPWMLVAEIVSRSGKPFSSLVDDCMRSFPASGEINRKVADANQIIDSVRQKYAPRAKAIDEMDGISMEFDKWRFNLRTSNTEPVIRLNVESRGDADLMKSKTAELISMLEGKG
jgi:phosphomannomutase